MQKISLKWVRSLENAVGGIYTSVVGRRGVIKATSIDQVQNIDISISYNAAPFWSWSINAA